jgi:hypothetical protein
MSDKNYHGIGMTINTLFFNQFYSILYPNIPVKPLRGGIRGDFTLTRNDPIEIDKIINSNQMLCYSDYGMVQYFVTSIENLFPNKSKFEL